DAAAEHWMAAVETGTIGKRDVDLAVGIGWVARMRELDRPFDVRPLFADFRNAHGGAARRGITAAPLAFLPRVDGARIAPLNHEAGQRAMKVLSVVKPVSHELQDMGDGFRRLVRIGLAGERA